ncbi:LytTR family DNA-binding domain-containing protein [Dyella sp. 2YAF14]|uniref:LytTR family DNA-binding domain-containing protein n=1 Tax=Dyella sp. 2YAF14 TaxID=3233025 RepID=UPI003F923C60
MHTAGRTYLLRRTLQDLLSQLGEQRFVRIHRSTAVNLGCIQSLTPLFKGDYEVHLRNGRTLRLSRRFRAALFARMGR